MLGERSAPAAYWEEVGRQALRQGVERIVMMGAHWECTGNRIEVSANPNPPKQPVTWVDPKKYKEFDTNPDLEFAKVVRQMLADKGFEVYEQPEFESIHDTFMIQKWMFPKGKSLPTVIVSHNARFDPHFHMKIGAALRPLRYQKVLLIGSGGAVHNLYRNNWKQVTISRDSFAQERPPEQWAIDFGQAFSDIVTSNNGPALRRGLSRLMQHPQFRDAQGTDDHFMSALFAAGAAGDNEDSGKRNYAGAECWELLNMRNVGSQNTCVGGSEILG